MKTKLILFFVLYCFTIQAQKQLQSYEYTVGDETIIIKASAKSASNITFILSDSKAEPFKNEEGEEDEIFEFTVSPFIQVIFFTKLEEQITKLEGIDETEPTKYKDFKDEELYLKIFRYFEVLANSEFKYNTKPIAGILKYNLNVRVETDDEEFDNFKHVLDNYNQNSVEIDTLKAIHEKDGMGGINRYIHQNRIQKFINTESFNAYILNKNNELEKNTKIKEITTVIENLGKDKQELENKKTERQEFYASKFNTVNQDSISEEDVYFLEISEINNLIEKTQIEIDLETSANTKKELSKRKEDYKKDSSRIEKNHLRRQKRLKEIKDRIIEKQKSVELTIKSYANKIGTTDSILKIKKSIKQNLIKTTDSLVLVNKKKIPQIIEDLPSFYFYDFKINNINTVIKDGFIDQMLVTGSIENPYLDFKDIILSLDKLNDSIIEENKEIEKSNAPIQNKINTYKDDLKKLEESYKVSKKSKQDSLDYKSYTNDKMNNLIKEKLKLEPELPLLELDKLKSIIKAFYDEPMIKETLNEILGKELKFENSFPFGFSSNQDFSALYGYELNHKEFGDIKYRLPVTDVFKAYNQELKVDRLDYSPANQEFSLPDDDTNKVGSIELKKEESSKILSAKFYTDFAGFKDTNPNGLLQIEIDKMIPLLTKRYPINSAYNYGYFNYVNLNLTFSRIDDQEQNLQVSYVDEYINNVYTPKKFVTYMDLVRRENTSIGLDVNVYSLDYTPAKLKLEVNLGVHFARVRVIDSLKTNTGAALTNFYNKSVNTLRYYPDVILRVRPEERFGGFIRFRPFRILTPGEDDFFSVSSRSAFLENRKIKEAWLHRYELSLFFKPNPSGDDKFFFRYKNTNVSTWETNGFGEYQFGYLAYLKF